MSAPRRILVPIDLGDDSRPAREVGAELAGALGAELVLVGVATIVVNPASGALEMPSPDLWGHQNVIERLVRARLEEVLGEVPSGVQARWELRWGRTGPAVVDAARDAHADVVVVTRRHESALEHLLDDHMQRYVLNHCSVPVLVVPA
jgi:nucleotide-binding universal stress UspA family protein